MRLLVAALERELVAFPAELPGFERLVTGPGKLQATHALTRALERTRYEEIVVVGTAGAIHEDVEATVHDVTSAIQHDVTDLDHVVGQHVSLPAVLTFGQDGHTIATGDHFIDDAEVAAGIQALGASLVDMEVYAYVGVAQQYDVPIRVLKAVSDRARDGALADWGESTDACSALLRERIRNDYGL